MASQKNNRLERGFLHQPVLPKYRCSVLAVYLSGLTASMRAEQM